MAPANRATLRIQRRFQRVMKGRAVIAGPHVVLAGPDQFDRRTPVDGLGDVHGFEHVVGILAGAPAEAAAGVEHVERDLFRLQAQQRGHRRLVDRLELLAIPDLACVRAKLHDAVQWLHGRVREIREIVSSTQHARGFRESGIGVALLAGNGAGRFGEFAVAGKDCVAAELERGGLVPFHLQGLSALAGAPGVLGQHGDAGRDLHDIHHALDGLGGRGVEGPHLRAKARRVRDHGRQHAGQMHVLREARPAVDLVGAVLARGMLADELEVLRRLELDVGRHGQLRSRPCELAEAGPAPGARMNDHTLVDADLLSGHPPLPCSSGHQHGTRGRARLAQLLPGVGDGRTAARALERPELQIVVALGIRRGTFHAHLGPGRVELLGNEGGEPGIRALPHLDVFRDDRHGAVGTDAHKRVRLERLQGGSRAPAGLAGPGRGTRARQVDRQGQSHGAVQEVASACVLDTSAFVGHGSAPLRPGSWPHREWRRGCGHRWRIDRYCRPWRHRCRHRSAGGCSPAAPRRS